MTMFDDRSRALEIMDDFSLSGEELVRTLGSIERVNRWLGGTRVMLDNLEIAFADGRFDRTERPVTLVDLGCGSGDGLRAAARWARRRNRSLVVRGVDANPFIVEYARSRTRDFPEVRIERGNVMDPALDLTGTDIVALNLFLHHLTDPEILALLERCRRAGVRAILVNDLHRHRLAYTLFPVASFVFRSPPIARADGLTSIRKSFRRHELVALARRLKPEKVHLRWRWAFRYQLVLILPHPIEPGDAPGEDV
jgi:SAM-dependent methyltransferase